MPKPSKWRTDPNRPDVLVRKFDGGCEARIMTVSGPPGYHDTVLQYEIELFPTGDAYSAGTLSEAKRLAVVYSAGYRQARAEYSAQG